MTSISGKLSDANNARILDAIRHDSSLDYQNRIPEATKAGVDAVLDRLNSYRPNYNEFENALVNRIGMVIGRTQSWENPLKEFKKGLLQWGDTVEEFQVGLLKAYTYDPARDEMEEALFAREMADVQANFHQINRQENYRITVNQAMLKRAFLEENGLSTYVTALMNAPITSDNVDEFLLMVRLFPEYESRGGFHKVNIPEVSDIDSTADDARRALRIVRSLSDTMTFVSTRYNTAHMPVAADANDLVLFCTPEFAAALDVNALAAAFNIDKANIPNRIIKLPREHFNIVGCEAILTTKDFFQVYDTLMENTSQWNPAGLATKYFWHHHQIISASRFVPAVMFTTGPGDEVIEVSATITSIDEVTVADIDGVETSTVERGMTYQAAVELTTDPVDALEQGARLGITWDVLGRNSTRTSISQTGVLVVAPDETATTLTVVAYDSSEDAYPRQTTAELAVTPSGDSAHEWPVGSTPVTPEPDPEP